MWVLKLRVLKMGRRVEFRVRLFCCAPRAFIIVCPSVVGETWSDLIDASYFTFGFVSPAAAETLIEVCHRLRLRQN